MTQPAKLTPKQARFVAEYLIDLNGTQAAIRAGFSKKSADKIAFQLLGKTRVRAAVEAGKAKQLEKAEVSAARVLEELRRIAFLDPGQFFDENMDLRPMKDLPVVARSAVASLEVIIKNAKAGDNMTDLIHKLKWWDKLKALELLMKHLGILEEKVSISGDWDKLAQRLASIRQGK